MSTKTFNCSWDSGQVGFIFLTESQQKEYGVETAHVIDALEACVKEYDQYLTGDMYGYVVSEVKHCDSCGHDEEVETDSCWGFFGSDWKENGIFSSAGFSDTELHEAIRNRHRY